MSNVERRIVEMRFDNEDFEKNVGETLVSLETLQKALQMADGTKGLNNVAAAAKNVDLTYLENGVQNVADRFSTLGIIGMRVLQNLTDMAMSMIGKLGNTFLGPLFSGGKQRAMNMAQAKFMFSGLGRTAKEIGSVGQEGTIMDNLYKSVEGTFYSLDRAALIGSQLMAAGVDYKTELTEVMRSIAGVASVYNMDYQRVGQLFAQIKAADALTGAQVESFRTAGVPIYSILADYLNEQAGFEKYTQENIIEMISDKDIDFDKFTKAMAKYADQAQKSKQLFTGAFEDMAAAMARIGEKMWKPLIDWGQEFFNATVPLINAVNEKLAPAFKRFGTIIDGFKQRTGSIVDFAAALLDLNGTITELKKLYELNDLEQGIEVISPERLTAIKKYREQLALMYFEAGNGAGKFKAYYDALKALHTGEVLDPETQKKAAEALKLFDKALADGKIPMENFFLALGASVKEAGYLKDILDGAKAVIDMFKRGITALKDALADQGSNLRKVIDIFLSFFALIGRGLVKINEFTKESKPLQKIFDAIAKGLTKIVDLVSNLAFNADKLQLIIDYFKNIFTTIKTFGEVLFSPIVERAKEFFTTLKEGLNLDNLTKAGGLAGLSVLGYMIWNLYKMFTTLGEKIRTSGGSILLIGDTFNQLRLYLFDLKASINFDWIKKIAWSILILAGAMLILSSIDPAKLAAATLAMKGVFTMLEVFFYTMREYSGLAIGKTGFITTSFLWVIQLAAGMLLLSAALKIISGIDNLGETIIALGTILLELIGFMKLFSKLTKFDPKGFKTTTKSLTKLAFAILLLVIPIKILSTIPSDEMWKSLKGLGTVLFELASFMYLLGGIDTTDIGKACGSMILLALAINMLLIPVKVLSKMDTNSLVKGIVGIGVIMAEIAGFMYQMSFYSKDLEKTISAAASVILLAIAINLLMKPVKTLAAISSDSLMVALGALAVLMLGISAFFTAMAAITKDMSVGNLLALSGTLIAVSISIRILGTAIVALSALDPASAAKGVIALGVTLLILSAAMYAMKDAAKGVPGMLAVAFALMIMAPALILLSTINIGGAIVGIIALGAAIAIFVIAANALTVAVPLLLAFGGAIALLGIGVFAFAAGMQLLATTFATGIAAIIMGIKAFLPLVPEILKVAVFGLVGGLAEGIVENAHVIFEAIKVLIIEAVHAIKDSAIEIIDAGIFILLALLTGIDDNMDEIVKRGVSIVVKLINGISDAMDQIVDAGFRLVEKFLFGIANGISTHGPTIVNALLDILLSVLEVIVSYIPVFGDKAAASIREYREGLESGEADVSASAGHISQSVDENLEVPDQTSNGRNAVQGLINGMNSLLDEVRSTASTIGDEIDKNIRGNLGIHSPSRKLFAVGEFATMGLINGMNSLKGDALKAAIGLGTSVNDGVANSFSSLSFVPSVSPNIDMSTLQGLAGTVNVKAVWSAEAERQQTLIDQMESMSKTLADAIQNQEKDFTYNFTIPFDINGREFARATATYNQQELDRTQMLENRKLGIL